MTDTVLRRRAVERLTGLPKSTLYRRIADGQFPRPIRLAGRASGWLESEIMEWVRQCTAERDGASPPRQRRPARRAEQRPTAPEAA